MQQSLFQRFDREHLASVPWKNGGGVTREIACYPAGADLQSFEWRISIADITREGPFSDFSGIDRVITLLSGKGMRLVSPKNFKHGNGIRAGEGSKENIDHLLNVPLQPFGFSGDLTITAELLDGACQDLNVMTRRGVCTPEVSVIRKSGSLGPAPAGMLMSVLGTWRLNDQALQPGQGLWWAEGEATSTAFSASTAMAVSTQSNEAALLAALIYPVKQ